MRRLVGLESGSKGWESLRERGREEGSAHSMTWRDTRPNSPRERQAHVEQKDKEAKGEESVRKYKRWRFRDRGQTLRERDRQGQAGTESQAMWDK